MSKGLNLENKDPTLLQKVTNQLHSDASHPRKMESAAQGSGNLKTQHQCSVLY